MKYIKTFESNNDPKQGDYVIVHIDFFNDLDYYTNSSLSRMPILKQLANYVNNNIGTIEHTYINFGYNVIMVQYPELPKEFTKFTHFYQNMDNILVFKESEIVYHSSYKPDVESILIANKYNL